MCLTPCQSKRSRPGDDEVLSEPATSRHHWGRKITLIFQAEPQVDVFLGKMSPSDQVRVVGFFGSGVSLHTATVPHEIRARVHERMLPSAMRAALNEIDEGRSLNSMMRISRAKGCWMVCQTPKEGCPPGPSCASSTPNPLNTSGRTIAVSFIPFTRGKGAHKGTLCPCCALLKQHGALESIQDFFFSKR